VAGEPLATDPQGAIGERSVGRSFGGRQSALSLGVSEQTLEILEQRRRTAIVHRRGWLVRRILFLADVLGISLAALVTGIAADLSPAFLLTIPLFLVLAKLYGLYSRDEERANHTTVDDIAGVFHVLTVGTFLLLLIGLVLGIDIPVGDAALFWGAGMAFVIGSRVVCRSLLRRSLTYLQNTVILGAGDVGQLIARKMLQHPEYGINLVGFVDANPKAPRADLGDLTVLGTTDDLAEIIDTLDVERVVVAFSSESSEDVLELIRSLRDYPVQIDIVPRLFEAVGPSADIHTIEGFPLVGLPSVRITRTSRWLKRCLDLAIAVPLLLLTAPLFAYVALRVRRSSPGGVLFRQERLGMNMKPFTMLKFRTMVVDADVEVHRDYIRQTMSAAASPTESGLYKLDRADAITPVGRWLRRSSLDELPQLVNVIKGEMSLVGPRPCIPYETEFFEPHHFERFLVPQGITGLWQVEGRALMTPKEALDLDVAYARGWSLSLDLSLLLRTVAQVFGRGGAA
jgi:exopolysaccharide biosynthesis polyprenyl glycosylphosphotransferase